MSSFDLQKFLEDPKSNYTNFLTCSEGPYILATNKELQAKFLSMHFLLRTFKLLFKTKDYAVHRHFLSLSQSLNPILAPRFAESLHLTEAAFEIIDRDDTQSSYAFGTISTFLKYAIHNYQAEMQEVFDLSKKIYPIMIRNIDKTAMLVFVNDILNNRDMKLEYFLWLCFKTLVGENEAKKFTPIPLCQYLRHHIDCTCNLTEVHISNIISLITTFFQKNEGSEAIFSKHIAKYISSQQNITPSLFQLGAAIIPDKEICNKAFEAVCNFEDTGWAAFYIIKYYHLLSKESLQYVVLLSLTSDKITNLSLNYIPRLVENISEKGSINEMKNILMYSWNTCNDNELKKPFIIKCISKIRNLAENVWPEKYITEVIEPWNKDEDTNFDYQFEASEIDTEFIEFLRHLFENHQ